MRSDRRRDRPRRRRVRLAGGPPSFHDLFSGLLAIAFFLFGIARAWQLVGAREFNLMATVAAMIHRPGGESPHRADGEQPGRAGQVGRGEP
jgi:hypothetical protein